MSHKENWGGEEKLRIAGAVPTQKQSTKGSTTIKRGRGRRARVTMKEI